MDQGDNARTRRTFQHVLFLLLVVLLVYIPTLRYPFIGYDDMTFIVQNAPVNHWSLLPAAFFPRIFANPAVASSSKSPNLYRPITSFWVVSNSEILGLHAVLWRAEILLLYGLCVWLFWRLAYALTGKEFVALAAALLFAVHPLQVEGVAWLSGAGVELLLCIFFLAGFLAYLRWRQKGRLGWLVCCGVLVLLSLLTKETGAALPVLIMAHALMIRADDEVNRPLRCLRLGTAIFLPIALYVVLRFAAIHSVGISKARHGWIEVWRSIPLFFSIDLQHAFWPFHLASWYDVQLVHSLSLGQFYFPLLLCLAYLGITLWMLARKSLAGLLLLWWVLPLSVALVGVANFMEAEYIHDRFAFIALGGFCVLAAEMLDRLPKTEKLLFGFSATSVALLALVTAVLGLASTRLVLTWQSDLTMAAHAVEVSPTLIRPRILLGVALEQKKDREGALAVYRDTLRLDPNRWETLFAYGTALANDGDRVDAVKVLAHGLDVAPSKSAFYLILADIFADAGRYDDATRLLERGLPVAEKPELLRAKLSAVQTLRRHATNP